MGRKVGMTFSPDKVASPGVRGGEVSVSRQLAVDLAKSDANGRSAQQTSGWGAQPSVWIMSSFASHQALKLLLVFELCQLGSCKCWPLKIEGWSGRNVKTGCCVRGCRV